MQIRLRPRRPWLRRIRGLKYKRGADGRLLTAGDGRHLAEGFDCKWVWLVEKSKCEWETQGYSADDGVEDGVYEADSGDGHHWIFIKNGRKSEETSPFKFPYTIANYRRDQNAVLPEDEKLASESDAWRHLWASLQTKLDIMPAHCTGG